MWTTCRRLWHDDRGQDVVEYTLLTAFFGLAALAAWTSIRDAIGLSYSSATSGVNAIWDPPPPGGSQVIDAPSLAVLGLGVAATLADSATRRIPNALTFGAAAVAVAFAAATAGLTGVGWSVAGWAVGVLLFMPLFVLRAMGGGDVKLLAAFGAWLGPAMVCWVAVYGAIAGGILAVPWLVLRGRLGETLASTWSIVAFWRAAGLQPHPVVTLDNPRSVRMPYALPIALGALATLWLRVW